MMNKVARHTIKALVVVVGLALSYGTGKRIGDIFENDDTLSEDEKIMYTYASCTLTGSIIGLIMRYIVKRI